MPGTLQTGGVPFGTTHWSVIAACTSDSSEGAQAALTQLCRDYWPPLYSFVRRRGYDPHDAQDLVQGFFAQLLRNKAYARTSPNKGRFRTFLLASLKHYIADVWDRERALKRGGDLEFVLLDEELHAAEIFWEPEGVRPTLNDEQHFEQRWAIALVTRSLMRLEAEVARGAKEAVFRELKPLLSGGVGLPSQEEIAARLNIPIETLRSHLSRLRTRYRAILRKEVARTVARTDDVDEELRHLCGILTAAC